MAPPLKSVWRVLALYPRLCAVHSVISSGLQLTDTEGGHQCLQIMNYEHCSPGTPVLL